MTFSYFPESTAIRRPVKRGKRLAGTTKRKAPEHKFQVALVKHLRRFARCKWYAVETGYRHLFTATKQKAAGVKRGTPDLHFCLPPNGRIAYLELKAPKGVLSPEQKAFRDDVTRDGALWAFARTLDEALGILAAWGVVPSGVTGIGRAGGGK